MSLKDRFDKFIEYFTEDGDDVQVAESRVQQQAVKPSNSRPAQQEPVRDIKHPRLVSSSSQHVTNTPSSNENITRLHARQQELAQNHSVATSEKVTIDVRYPKK